MNYRYAFQGQELDTETNMEAFQLRLWDGRIGRWLSPDPKHQHASPYLGMGNNPISRIDPDGGEDFYEKLDANGKGTGQYEWFDGSGAIAGYEHLGVAFNNSDTGAWGESRFGPIVTGDANGNVFHHNYILNEIVIKGTAKANGNFNNFRSDLINVSFDKGADNPVNPKLTNYLTEVIKEANEQGIFSINISSTTNHTSNSKNSAHSIFNGARALDINVINGVHVSPSDANSRVLQKIIQSTPGWRENYGPSIIQKMNNGIAIPAPWARDIKGGHYDHVHVSVPR